MIIYKEIRPNQWRKIFDEHLYEKHFVFDPSYSRLQMMIVGIYAGDARCKPNRKVFYPTSKSCNLIVTYKNEKWNWSPIK
jgi:hypothetical protein